MHARLWEQPNLKNRSLLGLHTTSLDSVLSPRLVIESNRPKSWVCEPISEEPSSQDRSIEGTVHLETAEHQRHHRHRNQLIRTQSAPLLISTTTTSPVHIKYVFIFCLFHLFPYLPSSPTSPIIMTSSLMPRSDSFNARVRGTSHIDFKTATTGVAAKTMRNEISRLVATVDDPATKKVRSVIERTNNF